MDKRTCSGASPNMFHLRYWKSSPVKYKVIYIGLYKQPTIYLRNNVARRGNGIVFSRVLEDHRYLGNALRTAMLFTSPSGYVFTLGSKRPRQVFTEAWACPGEYSRIPSSGGPIAIFQIAKLKLNDIGFLSPHFSRIQSPLWPLRYCPYSISGQHIRCHS